MAAEVNWKIDYNKVDNTIIISGKNVDSDLPPIKLNTLRRYKYTENTDDPIKKIENGSNDDRSYTYDDWVTFQQVIRMLDMMKDGRVARGDAKPIPSKIIHDLMYPNLLPKDIPYTTLGKIVEKIRSDVAQQITSTTWTNPNERFENIRKLDSRNTYKESGIGPKHVINDPIYCCNLANRKIDPLRRAYPHKSEIREFPPDGETLTMTMGFFDFLGLNDCSLTDKTVYGHSHEYILSITKNQEVTQHTEKIKIGDSQLNWFAGNVVKNTFFKNYESTMTTNIQKIKKGLLNSKELGDVSQVGEMFVAAKCGKIALAHSMVTGDEIVFILCILLGLDCIFYYHPRKSNHQIFHFKGEYKLKDAEKDFMRIRSDIEKTNSAIIYGILEIINNDTITIELRGFTLVHGFRLSNAFLQDMVDDMVNITFRLSDIEPERIYDAHPDRIAGIDEKIRNDNKISLLIDYMTKIKEEYKLKEPFTTYKDKRNTATFSTSYKSYTQVIPAIPNFTYYLKGYDGKKTFYQIYKKEADYGLLQGGRRQRNQKGGVVRFEDIHFKELRSNQIWGQYWANQFADTYRDIFELTFYPVFITIKDKDFEEFKIDSDEDVFEMDVHKEWKASVDEIIEKFCSDIEWLKDYKDDIWWELYNIYYIKNGDINREKLVDEIARMVVELGISHDENKKASTYKPIVLAPSIPQAPSFAWASSSFLPPLLHAPSTPPRPPRGVSGNSSLVHTPTVSPYSRKHKTHKQRTRNAALKQYIYTNNNYTRKMKRLEQQKLRQDKLNEKIRARRFGSRIMNVKGGGRRRTKKHSRNKTHRKRRSTRQ